MPARNIAGQVSDRHGIPLLHALRLDVTALDSVTPSASDSVLAVVDGELVLALISDLPGGSGPADIFDLLSANAILTISQPDLAAADITLTVDQTAIDHDALLNFIADEHVAHSGVTLTAGVGLAGGGNIAASRTFDIDWTELTEDTSPDEAADFVATYDTSAGAHKKVKFSNVDHDNLTNGAGNKHIDHTAVTLTAGVGLSGGGTIAANRTFDLDITELTEDTNPDEAADFLVTYDTSAGAHKKVKPGSIDHNGLTNYDANLHQDYRVTPRTSVAVDTTLSTHYYVAVDSSGGAKVITLPTTNSAGAGRTYIVKRNGSSSVTINPAAASSNTIDSGSSLVLSLDNDAVTLVSNGDTGASGDWEII